MGELFLIFTFILILAIILGLSVNGIVQKDLDYKRDLKGLRKSGELQAHLQLDDRTEMIEDRLRVLERLATDRSSLLNDEIEALRDRPALSSSETGVPLTIESKEQKA